MFNAHKLLKFVEILSDYKSKIQNNYHKSELVGWGLCISDSSECIKVLSEVVVHPCPLDRPLDRLHLDVLTGGQARDEKEAQEMPHFGSAEKGTILLIFSCSG